MSVSVRGLHSAAPGSLFRSADSVARQPRLTCLRFRLISGLERTPHPAAQPRRVLRSVRRHLSGLRAGRRARGAPLDLPARGGHNWAPPDRFLHVLPRHHHVGHLVHLLRRRIAGTPLRALPRLPGRPARTSRPLGAQAPRPGSARQGGLGSLVSGMSRPRPGEVISILLRCSHKWEDFVIVGVVDGRPGSWRVLTRRRRSCDEVRLTCVNDLAQRHDSR